LRTGAEGKVGAQERGSNKRSEKIASQ
jgi:hypothetical protein